MFRKKIQIKISAEAAPVRSQKSCDAGSPVSPACRGCLLFAALRHPPLLHPLPPGDGLKPPTVPGPLRLDLTGCGQFHVFVLPRAEEVPQKMLQRGSSGTRIRNIESSCATGVGVRTVDGKPPAKTSEDCESEELWLELFRYDEDQLIMGRTLSLTVYYSFISPLGCPMSFCRGSS